MEDGDPLGGGSGTLAMHMAESTAGKGLLCTTSLPVFLPSAFTGSQLGHWIKGMSPYRRFYSSKCHLRPYFTAHRPNSPPKINPCVLKHPLILHMAEQAQRSLVLSCNRAVLLLELGAEGGIFKS